MLLIATFYGLYTLVRDVRGDRPVSVFQATTNAHRIIRLERALGLFHEANIQHWFLQYRELIRLCDDYYGTVHFVAAIGVLGAAVLPVSRAATGCGATPWPSPPAWP